MAGATETDILKHFRLDAVSGCQCYLLLTNRSPVTVRAQQVRAMNLAWALRDELKGERVAVIGGGAAGLTFAAAAAGRGATVHLFESGRLMHLQMGSWHRPLHPEIYTWPEDTAYRPVSHLPILGWSAGTAHEVATEILSKFRRLQAHHGERLTVRPSTPATLATNGEVTPAAAERSEKFDIVVLAVGFGVEGHPLALPLNSYWRVDALDQTFLGGGEPAVAVVGIGDGGLIEVLRCCVPLAEQGPFLDKVLSITLPDTALRDRIRAIEAGDPTAAEKAYQKLDGGTFPALAAIDSLLLEHQRSISVTWLMHETGPLQLPPSGKRPLPINRLLVSRLLHLPPEKRKYTLTPITIEQGSFRPEVLADGTYRVWYKDAKQAEPQSLGCHQVVARFGYRKVDEGEEKGLPLSVKGVFADAASAFLTQVRDRLDVVAETHGTYDRPVGWDTDAKFARSIAPPAPPPPTLLAEFVRSFGVPREGWQGGAVVYRLRICLRWSGAVPEGVSVRYDLHPEEGNRPLSRVGIGSDHEQWLNTMNDYGIRVRTGDGYEWHVGTVLQAIGRRYALPVSEDPGVGARPAVEFPGVRADGPVTERVDAAIATLVRQTSRLHDEEQARSWRMAVDPPAAAPVSS